MFNTKMHIAFLGILATGTSCANESDYGNAGIKKAETSIYANEYGEIRLTQINNTEMQAVFFDNEKEVFDTLMSIDSDFKLLPDQDLPFLKLQTGGIQMYDNRLEIHDFTGPAYMAMYTGMNHIYDKPFYKLNDTVTIKDNVTHPKGGEQIAGLYVIPNSGYQNEFVELTGIITKEKYPREYYSTPDSPQGMFSDTTQIYYRLVIKPISVNPVKKQVYEGRTMNINGQAAFIWDFADSEAYYLDNHAPWTEEDLDKKITIEAVLVQFIDGKSVLKSWKIID
ncbi:MAG: hypothetical protein HYZ14_03355 [Bacteroidetes bacterium]|nr:hypothetical protein [Bacteroidota bacterium]